MKNNRTKKSKRVAQTNSNRKKPTTVEIQNDSEVENTNTNKSLKRRRKNDDSPPKKKPKRERKEKKVKTKKPIEKEPESDEEDEQIEENENEREEAELDNSEEVEQIDEDGDDEPKSNDEQDELELTDNQKEHNDNSNIKREVQWSNDDLTELVTRMENSIPEHDSLAYSTRAEKLDWDKIAFNNYSGDDCKKMWAILQKRTRRFRLLSEVLSDARKWLSNPKSNFRTLNKLKRHPDMPRRPPSSYILFCLDNRDKIVRDNPGLDAPSIAKLLGQQYRSLTPDEREAYEIAAAESRVNYAKNLQDFYEQHPEETPVKNEKVVKEEKLPKIDKVPNNEKPTKTEKPKLEKSPKTDKPTKINKAEKPVKSEKPVKIEKEKKERPPKRCQTAFNLYFQSELTNKNVEDKSAFKEKCKEAWKQLSDKKKLPWILKADEAFQKYKEEVKNYREKHPDDQVHELKSILTKEEKLIKKRSSGEPDKPPNSAYNLYSKTLLQSEEIKAINPKDRMNHIANKWKNLDEEDRQSYRDQYSRLMEKYKSDLHSYLESLPEEERALHEKLNKRERKTPSKSTKQQETKVQTKLKEPVQPPISASKYFISIYKGDGDPMRAWKALSCEEKRKYEDELTKKKEAYIIEFEKFLKSLSQEELEAFSRSRQQQVKSDDESSECSDDYDVNGDGDSDSNSCESGVF